MTAKPLATRAPSPAAAPEPAAGGPEPAEPAYAGAAGAFCGILAEVTGSPEVSADSDFFAELGADSLVMARFCARVRKRADLPAVSMRDVYQHRTAGALAGALAGSPATAETRTPAPEPAAAPVERAGRDLPGGPCAYVLCGALQLLLFCGYASLIAGIAALGYEWISAGGGAGDAYLRSVLFGSAALLTLCLLPVAAKWLLAGRYRPGTRIPVWGPRYVRFWLVKTLLLANPVVLLAGSPLYSLYLRALGARIGRGAVVFSRHVPACPDLLTVGPRTVVRRDVYLNCYRAEAGVIRTGAVTIGADALVSEATVLDIATALGDGAQLGHASSLHSGQAVPAGERWYGSPAAPGRADFRTVPSAGGGALRRAAHGVLTVLTVAWVYLPFAIGGAGILLAEVPQLEAALAPGPTALTSWVFYAEVLGLSTVLFFGALPLALLLVASAPRLAHRILRPDTVYPLYGVRYAVHRFVALTTNRRFLMRLFGDSCAVTHYLGLIGYRLAPVQQTGSNFGTEVRHETPYLATVGTGTMVADGLAMLDADYSHTSFALSRTAVGPRNFLGNHIAYPSRGRTGDNCLLATKVMVPVDGEVRENTGLLGSPCFEIPRTVLRDTAFDEDVRDGRDLRAKLAAKTRHNAVSMVLYLLARWLFVSWLVLLATVAAELYAQYGVWAVAPANVAAVLSGPLYFALEERLTTARHPLRPMFCSIYDRRFWYHERYWKIPSETYVRVLNGTPFKNAVMRLAGVRIGRRVFDDGCHLTERALVAIGDGCTLNAGSVVQTHSQEDGAFKSEPTVIGARCTLGVRAFVHYGVELGEGAVLAPDTFLMKGEAVPPGDHWGGNPARPLPARDPYPAAAPAPAPGR
ncbi:peptide synthetase [Streptomyces solincola]|uniref:Peptide synthetase n=1 Tax=Streptomyces solincola TaxID=2100817 RepID=A0A2S9PQE2_9ACTN|nr:Pls/PosA family non-ribosomal peptide synthetase [Streptomyces solincola]PRH76639.1 peptide synthetase [Streptomyces solincola]